MGLFAKISGLDNLSEQYPVQEQAVGKEFIGQTLQLGAIRYRKCVTLVFSQQGFYLKVDPPLGRIREIFIPWDKIINKSVSKLYGRGATQLFVESPTNESIIVYNELFIEMEPYLKTRQYGKA